MIRLMAYVFYWYEHCLHDSRCCRPMGLDISMHQNFSELYKQTERMHWYRAAYERNTISPSYGCEKISGLYERK